MSEQAKIQSTEYQLKRLVNYLYYFAEKCKLISSYFQKEVEDKYALADFYQWCANDLYVSADKINSYITKIGGKPEHKEVEKLQMENFGSPVQSLEYIHNEDLKLTNLINEIYNFAEKNNDENLKNFMHKELITPLKAWNKNFDNSLPRLRASTSEQLEDTFKNTFEMMKKYRKDLSV